MNFDTQIHLRLKEGNRGYKGPKPSTQDLADILEEDPDFADDFKRVFNNTDIIEADDFTPEVLEDTYVDMEIVLPGDGEVHNCSKLLKVMQDANDILIGRQHENYMLDTQVFEAE